MNRCEWAIGDEMIQYHDNEWGKPVYDDDILFEFLILEGAQAGLSWNTILKRRENYRSVFCNYDLETLSNLSDEELDLICTNDKIIRNKLKVYSVRSNAEAFLEVKKEFDSFSSYIWSFTDFKVIDNKPQTMNDVAVSSSLSEEISKDMKKRGFKFVGPTIIYAYLQAIGIVNDHLINCCAR